MIFRNSFLIDYIFMNQNENKILLLTDLDVDNIDLDELESKLEEELDSQMSELQILKEEHEQINDPGTIGETIKNVVWEQFINQVGVVAGEDFIKENRGLTLDLRDSAHIQTTENFADGKIATHNSKIDYQQRYDDWQSNFQHDENGNVITHTTRTGKEEATLVTGARNPFDKDRPKGSAEKGTDMDHTVSAGEIIRDPAANAHLSKEEQIDFANSEANLNEMDASQNRSKGDNKMTDWLDNPNSKGQKPNEIFDISEEQEQKYREKDAEARAEYEKRKKEGEQRSIDTGKQSQKEEAFRIGGAALRAVLMGLLAEFIKDVIRHLVAWFRSGEKTLNTFIDKLKDAVESFFSNLKAKLLNAGNILMTTIATAIWGPIVNTIKKAWIFLKQGYKSVKDAVLFLKSPQNQDMPFSIKLLNVGKIVVIGLTAGGAILLGETIEKGLMSIPVFAIQIPVLGSLASLLGSFFGALISGIIGALALRMLDKAISNKLRTINEEQRIDKKNEIIRTQDALMVVTVSQTEITKTKASDNINERHDIAVSTMKEISDEFQKNKDESDKIKDNGDNNLKDIDDLLGNL